MKDHVPNSGGTWVCSFPSAQEKLYRRAVDEYGQPYVQLIKGAGDLMELHNMLGPFDNMSGFWLVFEKIKAEPPPKTVREYLASKTGQLRNVLRGHLLRGKKLDDEV